MTIPDANTTLPFPGPTFCSCHYHWANSHSSSWYSSVCHYNTTNTTLWSLCVWKTL